MTYNDVTPLIYTPSPTMDAHAHLLSLGWAGPGHSLDSKPYKQKGHRGLAYDPAKVGNNGNGLVKPLSISQRQGRFGIGKKAHEPPAGNEWWLKGFESALGNVGKSESERSSGTSTPLTRESTYIGKHGGLYNFFIRGQQMEGTMDKLETTGQRTSKKRKSDVLDETTTGAGITSRISQKKSITAEFEQAGMFFALRDKEEKRRNPNERPNPVEEFHHMSAYLEARSDKQKKKSKKRKSEMIGLSEEATTPLETDDAGEEAPDRVETREERRERRRQRREEREQRRKASRGLQDPQQHANLNLDADSDDAAAKAARRAERKRRKAEKAALSSKER